MAHKTIIIYKSSTEFTEKYARLLAEKLGGTAVDFKKAGRIPLSDFDTVIFGTRVHAGSIDEFDKFRKILRKQIRAHAKTPSCILFVTVASPATEQYIIHKFWKDSLTEEELSGLPHFYMPAGLYLDGQSPPVP